MLVRYATPLGAIDDRYAEAGAMLTIREHAAHLNVVSQAAAGCDPESE